MLPVTGPSNMFSLGVVARSRPLEKASPQVRVTPAPLQSTLLCRACSLQSTLLCRARSFALQGALWGVSHMESILPERLLALVRPRSDLRRIRSLKRCVEACGGTPRYAQQFGSRLHFKRCQALPKETPFLFLEPLFWDPLFSDFLFFPEALRRVLLLKAAANFTCQLLMPTCRELLHLPTSHVNFSAVISFY